MIVIIFVDFGLIEITTQRGKKRQTSAWKSAQNKKPQKQMDLIEFSFVRPFAQNDANVRRKFEFQMKLNAFRFKCVSPIFHSLFV